MAGWLSMTNDITKQKTIVAATGFISWSYIKQHPFRQVDLLATSITPSQPISLHGFNDNRDLCFCGQKTSKTATETVP